VVQEGDLADVWQHPADAWTALFLGYARVLEGSAAVAVLDAAGLPADAEDPAVAVRRSALVLDENGPLRGVVVSARATPDQVRLVVDAAGIGEVDAVGGHAPGPGESVRLRVVPSRLAVPGPRVA